MPIQKPKIHLPSKRFKTVNKRYPRGKLRIIDTVKLPGRRPDPRGAVLVPRVLLRVTVLPRRRVVRILRGSGRSALGRIFWGRIFGRVLGSSVLRVFPFIIVRHLARGVVRYKMINDIVDLHCRLSHIEL